MATCPQRRKKEKEEIAQEQLNLVHETEKKTEKYNGKKLQNRRHGNCSSKRSQFCGKSVLKEAK